MIEVEVEVVEIEKEITDGRTRFRFRANNFGLAKEQPFPAYPTSFSMTAPDARFAIGDRLDIKISKRN
jgi:hypothetical protein